MDASHDSHYGPNLPSKVLAPLLTADAVDLLINCVTSKESELWHSLGETWYVPSEEWKDYVPPYRPVFMDGWSPASAENGVMETPRNDDDYDRERPGSSNYDRFHGEDDGERRRAYPERVLKEELRSDDEGSYDESGSKAEQREWAESMLNRGLNVVRVTYPRTANNEKELTVVRGEFLEVIDDSKKWWRTRNCQGVVGHVPHTIVASFEPSASHDRRQGRKGELRYF